MKFIKNINIAHKMKS